MQPTLLNKSAVQVNDPKPIKKVEESPIILIPGKALPENEREEIKKQWGDAPSEIVINPVYLSPYSQETKEAKTVSCEERNALGKDVSDAAGNELIILPQEDHEEKEDRPSTEEMKKLMDIIENDNVKSS